MNERVQLALIVGSAIVIVLLAALFIYRKRLRGGTFEMSSDSVKAGLTTHDPAQPPPTVAPSPITKISGNKLTGQNHKIKASQPGAEIADNELKGKDSEIIVD